MNFEALRKDLEGELRLDSGTRHIYATDASAYREVPTAVALPKTVEDIQVLVNFAIENKTSLIPRTAGTSLAGQVVGDGIVVDVSKYLGQILEVNEVEKWAWVQPGIVRDELNRELAKYGLFFAPETSTANRAMIGGMIGNNSCGSNSVVFGSTREHLLEVETVLSDGSTAHFGPREQMKGDSAFEDQLYGTVNEILADSSNVERILKEFPKANIPRRNTGYALDMLARMQPFNSDGEPFNFCSLIAGSEGTLAFVTAAKIRLTDLPPAHKRLVCIHCRSIDEALRANLVVLEHQPHASELIDHYILDATQRNLAQRRNRFFIEGKPEAILVAELIRESEQKVDKEVLSLLADLTSQNLGYAFPVLSGDDMSRVWELRKAGLGLLSNVPGDEKPVPVIEDTAVDVQELPAYIAEFNELLKKYGLYSVHYAHAGSGELHLRPIINLKTTEGVELFRRIAEEIALLVKKYKGSLSGEHGDGRLRGEFIPQMIGEENYQLLKRIKKSWDPDNIFNPGKIVDTAPMDTSLRFEKDQPERAFETMLDFSRDQGILRAAELCNGSGDCRKSALTGGTMCPSYMATRDERDTTRARANVLREFLTRSPMENPFKQPEIGEAMDLCLSCKGCKSECPSNVDMAKLKAEWQYQSYKDSGVPWRTKLVANYDRSISKFQRLPQLYNITRSVAKPVLGFAPQRSMPRLSSFSLRSWHRKKFRSLRGTTKRKIYFYFDEFTNHLDVEIGKRAIMLLDRLGYEVLQVPHAYSGRTYLSKGLLKQAKELAEQNIEAFAGLLNEDCFLVGIEPSAVLSFRDEYPDLLRGEAQDKAKSISQFVFTIDEFLAKELDNGNLTELDFSSRPKKFKVHGHCHQKALSSMSPIMKILETPEHWEVERIPSGCCGMAGSFGYEKEHYDISMKIGELVLFPNVREVSDDTIIVANGTSCRHQILDGTGKRAFHLVEVL